MSDPMKATVGDLMMVLAMCDPSDFILLSTSAPDTGATLAILHPDGTASIILEKGPNIGRMEVPRTS